MGLDFDVKTFCQNLRATKPPYECPVKACGKIYKSFCGIQFHLYNYDHDNPPVQHPQHPSPRVKQRRKGKWHPRSSAHRARSPSPPPPPPTPSPPHYREPQQRVVEVDLGGRVHHLDIGEPLDFVLHDGGAAGGSDAASPEGEPPDPVRPAKGKKHPPKGGDAPPRLPEAAYRVVADYDAPDAPAMPTAYFRFIEKSAEELDEEVEYDMDEEDCVWLDVMNERRRADDAAEVSADTFELLMDRLEKESYFQSQTSGTDPLPSIDEDAVCCICNDGECQNSNAILFCDMCNLAVHQECYGVPYIPEGQWLCRRCLQSPSRAVDCVLCPNRGGAFKQTDDGRWAHVVCALWIPEVCFANTVFLEPLDSIENIPAARWKLSCYVCKQRSVGACIQCHRANCYTAFHVTCAQQAGLYMRMEAVRETGANGTSYNVRKTAYCDVHAPLDDPADGEEGAGGGGGGGGGGGKTDSSRKAKAKAKSREKMKKARKILAEKRIAVPVVSLPTIPPERLTKIAGMVTMPRKQGFLDRLLAYWILKRQSRNGVPLLRRLQNTQSSRRDGGGGGGGAEGGPDLGEQLQYWQKLRQDLERARLLVELIRKREKLKRELVRAHQLVTEMQIQPLVVRLRRVVERLLERDAGEIFARPVDPLEVPDYLEHIERPMDLSTMMAKVEAYRYPGFDAFEADFDLMIRNCLSYNSKDTVFYRAALKMREQGGHVLREARRHINADYDFETGLFREREQQQQQADSSPSKQQEGAKKDGETVRLEAQLETLYDELDEAYKMKSGVSRSRRIKRLRQEINVTRRKISMKAAGARVGRRPAREAGDENKAPTAPPPSKRLRREEAAVGRTRARTKDADPPPEPRAEHCTPPRGASKRGRWRARETAAEDEREDGRRDGTPVRAGRGRPREKEASDVEDPFPATPVRSLRSREKEEEAAPPEEKRTLRTPLKRSAKESSAVVIEIDDDDDEEEEDEEEEEASSSAAEIATPVKQGRQLRNHPSPQAEASPGRPARRCQKRGASSPPPPALTKPNKMSPGLESPPAPPPARASPPARAAAKGASPPVLRPQVPVTRARRSTLESSSEGEERETRSKSARAQSRSHSENDAALAGRQRGPRKPRSTSLTVEGEILSTRRRASPPAAASAFPPTDSFKVYRSTNAEHNTDSDDDDDNNTESSRSSSSSSGGSTRSRSSSSCSSDSDAEGGRGAGWSAEEQRQLIELQPLDLVWAKCRGYPWYPALIISPDASAGGGCFHNGVPIPVPPGEVLALRDRDAYLVLFFDTKRTWQWLPRDKLEPLGVDSALDKARLVESKKAAERKAVKKAFENAILHRCRVTGESTILSNESGEE